MVTGAGGAKCMEFLFALRNTHSFTYTSLLLIIHWERERVCVCVCVSEREWVSVCVSVCVCECECVSLLFSFRPSPKPYRPQPCITSLTFLIWPCPPRPPALSHALSASRKIQSRTPQLATAGACTSCAWIHSPNTLRSFILDHLKLEKSGKGFRLYTIYSKIAGYLLS